MSNHIKMNQKTKVKKETFLIVERYNTINSINRIG